MLLASDLFRVTNAATPTRREANERPGALTHWTSSNSAAFLWFLTGAGHRTTVFPGAAPESFPFRFFTGFIQTVCSIGWDGGKSAAVTGSNQ
jgi:hypothetical protein